VTVTERMNRVLDSAATLGGTALIVQAGGGAVVQTSEGRGLTNATPDAQFTDAELQQWKTSAFAGPDTLTFHDTGTRRFAFTSWLVERRTVVAFHLVGSAATASV
jgi:hypothetical protein